LAVITWIELEGVLLYGNEFELLDSDIRMRVGFG